jgi:helicase, recD/traA family
MGEETTIMGTVLSVVFQNEENGYAVLRLVTDDGELLTLVGCVPCAAPGENLTATGSFSSHPQYGEQFSASEVERYLPSNETEILNYLASGVVRGVGPATAEKLVARFGIETLQVLESEPEKLTAIKGMTARRAQEISAAFNEQMGLRRVMEFLAHYDLPAALSVPLYRRFGANAMAALERNPYLLSDSAFGVDFSVCDEIALSMGFGGDASLRTEAGLLFELSHNRDAGGHVFLPREKLLAATAQLLDCDIDAAEKSLDDLIAIHRIVQEGVANVTACYLRQSWEDETYVVTRIEAMLADKPDALRGVERVIKEIEREQGVQYAPLQRQAVELAAKEELLLLTGGPGTGKTTTTQGIIAALKKAGLRVLLAAPTGRAAKRMSEATGMDAKTIHRLLEYNPQDGYKRGDENPLDGDALIVDECSMIDILLMNNLMKAVPVTMRLVLVGDIDQLPSVGAGNVLRDIIDSQKIPVVRLTRIFRQAQKSRIVMSAHAINQGRFPDTSNGRDTDFFFMKEEDPEQVAATVVRLVKERLPRAYGQRPDKIQVLTPMQRGIVGAANLNLSLQKALNPSGPSLNRGGYTYRQADRVMQVRNNYDKEVFNGDLGYVESVNTEDRTLTVDFDGRSVEYDVTELDELTLAYATTIHKAQGSEYPIVVLPVLMTHYVMLQRNLIYTGITRAKKICVLIGATKALACAIRNQAVLKRNTKLKERLNPALNT